MKQGIPFPEVRVLGLRGIPEVRPGDDLANLILEAMEVQGVQPQDGDVLVVTQKVVSKAEGRLVHLADVTPSPLAQRLAEAWSKDPRQVEVVLRESRRIVKMDRGLIISETAQGLVCANAGVDRSNVPEGDWVTLLPQDPDVSAERLRVAIEERLRVKVGVIISDTFGRPWRSGLVNVAVGVAGLAPLWDYRGSCDSSGHRLKATVMAIADELAAAAELVMGKTRGIPAALIKGVILPPGQGTAKELIRDPALDLFR